MRENPSVHQVHLATEVTLPYVESGVPAGPPVLLLHPWGESLRCFDRLLPLLPSSMRAIAMDQRGHGHADKPAGGYQLTELADDIVAFMDALEIGDAVLVGSSSGGYVAQQVAVSQPRRVRGLVLVGAPRSLAGRPPFADELDRLTDPVDRAWVAESLTWFPRVHPVPDWYVAARVDDGVLLPAHVWRNAFTGLVDAVPPTDLGTITAPTLILWGEQDNLLTRADEQELATAIPGSRLVPYERTGHLVLWEQPDRVAEDLSAFVQDMATPTPPS